MRYATTNGLQVWILRERPAYRGPVGRPADPGFAAPRTGTAGVGGDLSAAYSGSPPPMLANHSAARRSISSGLTSSLWVAMPHSWPKGSVTLP